MSRHLERVLRVLGHAASRHDFVAMERQTESVHLAHLGAGQRDADAAVDQRRTRSRVTDVLICRDVRGGSGSTRLRFSGSPAGLVKLIEDTVRRAAHSLEPAWALPLPAAPARVAVADPALEGDLMNAADKLRVRIMDLIAHKESALSGAARDARHVHVHIERHRVAVATSRGFAHEWPETMVAVDLALSPESARPGLAQPVRLQARRMADLDLEAALGRGARHLVDRERARPAPRGPYDLVITDDALTPHSVSDMSGLFEHHRAAAYGWFGALVAQADPLLAREGLARYQPGQSIHAHGHAHGHGHGEREPAGDALTLTSDGTIPFGLRSQPVGDLGEAVRRFVLVDRGKAAGLALDLREAALRKVMPNGGVRNLVVAPGSTPMAQIAEPATRDLIQAVELDWMSVDTLSGAFVAALGLGYLMRGREVLPVSGGQFRGNLFELLASARLSAETVVSGWYLGPRAIRFSGVELS